MIEIQNVSTSFDSPGGRFTAVDDVSLHIRRGTIQGIVGFSGAGKSTLLRNINLLARRQNRSTGTGGTPGLFPPITPPFSKPGLLVTSR